MIAQNKHQGLPRPVSVVLVASLVNRWLSKILLANRLGGSHK